MTIFDLAHGCVVAYQKIAFWAMENEKNDLSNVLRIK